MDNVASPAAASVSASTGKFLVGIILFFGGIALIIPTSIGIAEYNNADAQTQKKIKAQRGAQIFILVIALASLITGSILVSTSSSAKRFVAHGKEVFNNTRKDVIKRAANPYNPEAPTSVAASRNTTNSNLFKNSLRKVVSTLKQ